MNTRKFIITVVAAVFGLAAFSALRANDAVKANPLCTCEKCSCADCKCDGGACKCENCAANPSCACKNCKCENCPCDGSGCKCENCGKTVACKCDPCKCSDCKCEVKETAAATAPASSKPAGSCSCKKE